MNDAKRHTVQMFVGAIYGAAIIAAVIYLAVTGTSEGERNLLLGVLGGGFGAAISYFLGNYQQRPPGGDTTVVAQPPSTVNVRPDPGTTP